MNAYSIFLFFHIVGTLGVFVVLGLEWTGLRQLRSSTVPEQVRAWMGILKNSRKVGFISMLATVITGVYMMLKAWGGAPWIIVTVGALVLIIVLSLVLTGPAMVAVGRAFATGKGLVSPDFHRQVNTPSLWISIHTRVAIAMGIVFLKIARPDMIGSFLTIGAATLLGLASVLPMLRREQEQKSLAG